MRSKFYFIAHVNNSTTDFKGHFFLQGTGGPKGETGESGTAGLPGPKGDLGDSGLPGIPVG